MSQKKLLILGGFGQLGSELFRFFSQDDSFSVIRMGREQLDVREHEKAATVIYAAQPEIIINCIAMTELEKCEHSELEAYEVNGYFLRSLGEICRDLNAVCIHVSTDYVFYGELDRLGSLGFIETDEPNPSSVYGKSKRLGEIELIAAWHKHFIIRTSWVYGSGNRYMKGLMSAAKTGRSVSVFEDQYDTPTSSYELYRCMKALICTEAYGIYHGSCQGYCSKYEYVKKISKALNLELQIIPQKMIETPSHVRRPNFSVLYNNELLKRDIYKFEHWEVAFDYYMLNYWKIDKFCK